MARQRRTLDEQIAELVTRGRSARTETLSVPAMAPLGATMIEDNAIQNEHLSPNAIKLENLDEDISGVLDKAKQDVVDLQDSLDAARQEVVEIDSRLDSAASDLLEQARRIDDEVLPAIVDAAAAPITDARLQEASITVWPFKTGTIPSGALANGAVSSKQIADFSLVATKFNDNRHRIY